MKRQTRNHLIDRLYLDEARWPSYGRLVEAFMDTCRLTDVLEDEVALFSEFLRLHGLKEDWRQFVTDQCDNHTPE